MVGKSIRLLTGPEYLHRIEPTVTSRQEIRLLTISQWLQRLYSCEAKLSKLIDRAQNPKHRLKVSGVQVVDIKAKTTEELKN